MERCNQMSNDMNVDKFTPRKRSMSDMVCPLRDEVSKHYDTVDEARAAYEKAMNNQS